MKKTTLPVALIQERNHGDAEANLAVIEQRVAEAARQGAKLVESAQDILDELRSESPGAARRSHDAEQAPTSSADPVLDALGQDPVTLDALGARTGMSAQALQARLLELELEGRVARLPGGLFQRRNLA